MSETRLGSRSPQNLKRERDDEDDDLETPLYVPESQGSDPFILQTIPPTNGFKRESTPQRHTPHKRDISPARSSTGSLSDAGTTTPSLMPNSPATAFAALNGNIEPPKKRAKLTFAEKEEKRILKAIRDQERAEERARREEEKKSKEHDKARKDAEREAERQKREAERQQREAEKEEKRLLKEAEKAEKEKERKTKEDEKRRKEEEKERIEEEKRKKARQQPKLMSFFKTSATSKDDAPGNSSKNTPKAKEELNSGACEHEEEDLRSEYEKMFLPFFAQSHMTVAPIARFERDERASEASHDTLDSYLSGQRSPGKRRPFDATSLFNLPNYDPRPRGTKITPVKEIMSQILGIKKQPIDLTTDSQIILMRHTRDLLKKIPYKILSFAEDVRPPYKGTYTSQPMSGMQRLARNPLRRDLPMVDYDNDSEAEWEDEGDEGGEDIESEGEEEENMSEGEEDIEGFLDDADVVANVRNDMKGDLEPQCSGLCWEDENRRGPKLKMYRYLMEFMSPEGTDLKTPIDPFATHYWDPPRPTGIMEPPRKPLDSLKSTNANLTCSGNKPVKMFGTPNPTCPYLSHHQGSHQQDSSSKPPKKLVSAEDMPAFRQAVAGSELSKIGLIEVLNKQFPKISKATIKATLECIAVRRGHKEAEKRWVVIDD